MLRRKILYKNKFIHFFASILSFSRVRRRGNKIVGLLNPLRIRSPINLSGSGNIVSLGFGVMYKSNIFVEGDNNQITIDNGLNLRNTQIWIKGDGCKIILGENQVYNNVEIGAENSGSLLTCDDDTQIGGFAWLGNRPNRTRLTCLYAGEGRLVLIGRSARISENVVIKNYDSHVIYDTITNKKINRAKDIVIGNQVWVCPGSLVLKGAFVSSGSIVGSQSTVTKDFSKSDNVLLLGSPAKIVKKDVGWRL
ncbi:MAG: hypothetical protein FWC09_00865 [Lachnospiraceae bacterium]|nr:hypothetical protein [Lachnospiraceae bacterium]